jgi:hypothetical protein
MSAVNNAGQCIATKRQEVSMDVVLKGKKEAKYGG